MINPGLFSRAALHALHAVGWTPERCIDIADFAAMLKPYGWNISRPAQDILESFGDLDFTQGYSSPIVYDVIPSLPTRIDVWNLSFELAFFGNYDDDWLYRAVHEHPYIKAIQLDNLYPIGVLHYDNLIFVTPSGAIFIVNHSTPVSGYHNPIQVTPYGSSIYAVFDEFLRISLCNKSTVML